MTSSVSAPVNGKPTAPNMGGPAIIDSSNITNGTSANQPSDHSRKPSSVTISAQGTSGTLPNGTSSGPNSARHNISFGNFDAQASPASSHSVPHIAQNNSLSASIHNPGSARSPSPIPKPTTASGGRPPSSLSGAGALNFGSLPGAADSTDSNFRPGNLPQGPAGQMSTPQHLRRESSQSQHSDASPSVNRNFVPNGRGRGYNGNFQNQMPYSPMARPHAMQQRTPSNTSSYNAQGQLRGPQGSPYTANRSPAMPPAQLQQAQPFYPNGGPVPHAAYGYPPHFNAGAQAQGIYGQPQQFDPAYGNMYYQQPYGMHPGMQYGGAPASPRPYQQGQPPYIQGGYNAGQSMSRTSSQNPDRPTSALGQTAPSAPPSVAGSAALAAGGSPAPQIQSIQRNIEPRKSKAIVIKRPDGGEVVFNNKAAVTSPSPSPAPAKGPTLISSASGTPSSSTPPPRAAAATPPVHVRTESAALSADEKKAAFAEQFKRQLQIDAGAAPTIKEEPAKAEAKEEPAKEAEPVAGGPEPEAEQAALGAQPETPAETSTETEAERKKREEDEEMERMIAEMEAAEKEEEERERAFAEKKAKEKEEKARKEAEAKANADEELKRQEREAEERELAREKAAAEGSNVDDESAKLFAKLKRPTFGPGAEEDSGTSTPQPESPPATPAADTSTSKYAPGAAAKAKPASLKVETQKPQLTEPTPGMNSLSKSRFLSNDDKIDYPSGINAPTATSTKGAKYDVGFLLQFQNVFKEKPSIDWDKTLKETLGDSPDSGRTPSARTPSMGGRQPSQRGPGNAGIGAMGNFNPGAVRTLPVGTTSEQRFSASNSARPGAPMQANPFGNFGGRPGGFPMGAAMGRTQSAQSLVQQGGMGGRAASARGGKGSRRGGPNLAEEAKMAKTMPLTAGQDLKPLELSKTGWKATSVAKGPGGAADAPLPGGHMAPDMVQRKVKSSLNKMTPEKFEKISDDILNIAMQSKDEQDGRTLRQVIQLTFEKACDEAHWASMYARFCKRMLETMSSEIKDDTVRDKAGNPVVGGALFRKYLLNRCQEEFERGWEINLPSKPEGEDETNQEAALLSDEYYVAAAAKRRGLGLIQFIGELYKLEMLTIRIMHECVVRLLNFEGLPDESAVESLVKLLRTVGGRMETDERGPPLLGSYFERINSLMQMEGLPSRLYYMLLDTVDLRKKGWKSKDDQKGPKTIQQIHQEAQAAQAAAELERVKSQRGAGGRPPAGRGDARSFSGGGMPPPDYPRNTVGVDDLKRLAQRGNRQASSQGPASLGPASMLGSRSNSARRGLGPLSRGNEDSGASSRTGTPPTKAQEPTASANAYSALAALDGSGETEEAGAASPEHVASPPTTKATPAIETTLEEGKESKAA